MKTELMCGRLVTLSKHLLQFSPSSPSLFKNPVISACSSTKTHEAFITVEPQVGLYDEVVKIHCHRFPTGVKITLHGEVENDRKNIFASCGYYSTDHNGHIDVTAQSSQGGTYTGVEPMGIFWSLKPAPGQPPTSRLIIKDTERPCIFRLRAYLGHLSLASIYSQPVSQLEILASLNVERWVKGKDVTRLEIEEGRVRGVLYLPKGEGPFQGVIDMFGANGGVIEYRAALLASRGFAALCLPYFKFKDLPKDLSTLDYDYFEEAINWLSSHPKVHSQGIGVVATSKGVENALFMGAYSPKISAVVCINGYPFVTAGDLTSKGQVLLKGAQMSLDHMLITDEGLDLRAAYPVQSEIIPIWKGKAKYLILSSMDDFQINSNLHEELLAACPEEKKKDIEVVQYTGAGHLLEPPFNPLCRTTINPAYGIVLKFGGQPLDHARAQVDSWKRILEFLRKNIPTE
ncbi:unnamed protein product [Lymnaea stagnalis]|uniref:Uncharacterized protein n=1 Tax=Lymnaea stagnalis TaxID=6523 RepID=A0AAV2I709_LYMST